MFVGICRLSLIIPENATLKGKRSVVRRLIDRTRTKFNVAVAEVGANDDPRQGVIGFAVIGNESGFVDEMMATIVSFIEGMGLAFIGRRETEVTTYGDELYDGVRYKGR
ncbi:MAG: DUF503 domain-containing protein [Deltaproteobacteria bacterium]|nr:DUF503 domain-containing protein [Deltaproteobacteria bacterium]